MRKIIEQYLTQLEKFYFQYYVYINDDNDDQSPVYYRESNQFNSLFWNERQWIFETKTKMDTTCIQLVHIGTWRRDSYMK